MVNGNYVLYGDRPTSESEIVDDHIQTQTIEKKSKRKANRTANDLQNTLNQAQLDNETDSVKYEKKIKEPKLLRYVPTNEIEYYHVNQLETQDLKSIVEHPRTPRRYAYVKKPKNPSDGPVNNAYSRSSSSSPTSNLPTISEHCEQYTGTYRMCPATQDSVPNYESKLEKYFMKRPLEITKFTAKVDYNGSHPDSLYRVPPGESTVGVWQWGERWMSTLRLMRWPAALLLVCIALAGFVYFLMPDSNVSDLDAVNSTYWDNNVLTVDALDSDLDRKLVSSHSQPTTKSHHHQQNPSTTTSTTKHHHLHSSPSTTSSTTKQPGKITTTSKNGKIPEIDFYDPEIDLITIIEKTENVDEKDYQPRNLPIAPVFPDHISPEVQYGNEKADTRAPKILEKLTSPADFTEKPHITLKPEKPLSVYFKDTTATESITRAETVNDLSSAKQSMKSEDSKLYTSRNNQNAYLESNDTHKFTNPILPPGYKNLKPTTSSVPLTHPFTPEYKNLPKTQSNVPLTSGHSKFFGIGIEDVEKMTSSTTQSSVYNTRVSPTLPTWRDGDDATTKNYPVASDMPVPQCQSPRLRLCRGVLPYDLAGQPPTIDGNELTSLMPQIEYLISTNCSPRMRQYLCAILEPECSPAPYPPKLPCYNFCKAMMESCEGSIPRDLSTAFRCEQYSQSNCTAAQNYCSPQELACDDGSCIPREWMCNGKIDCTGGEDEVQCTECNKVTEYRCASGSCILKRWVCDGYRDCQHGDDEDEQMCAGLNAAPSAVLNAAPPAIGTEPGEESSGSAPAPSVRKPFRQDVRRTAPAQTDASQELLITSDSNNALKRNYTRRPSISRLTPYVPKVRTTTTTTTTFAQSEQETGTEKPFKSLKTTRRRPSLPKMTPKADSIEDLDIGDDLKLFEEYEKEAKEQTHSQNLAPSQSQSIQEQASKSNLRMPVVGASAEKLTRSSHKNVNNIEHVVFDGTASVMQSVLDAEKALEDAKVTNSFEEESEKRKIKIGNIRTSHSSPCPMGELRCVDGRCITLTQLCDGTIDCSDHADEDNCYT